MNLRKTLLAAVAAVAFATPAFAADVLNGNKLLGWDQHPDGKGLFLGYVNGWVDSYRVAGYELRMRIAGEFPAAVEEMNAIPHVDGWKICLPDNGQVGQAADVVRKFLHAHPEDRHDDAGVLVWLALHEAWPCVR